MRLRGKADDEIGSIFARGEARISGVGLTAARMALVLSIFVLPVAGL
jgi:hypothetical protein